MARTDAVQLNIRSRFARDRATLLARRTGMTATQVVEEALRVYEPQPVADPVPGRLVRKGHLLVMPAGDGPTITLEQLNDAVEATRTERE